MDDNNLDRKTIEELRRFLNFMRILNKDELEDLMDKLSEEVPDRHVEFFCTNCSAEWGASKNSEALCSCGSRSLLWKRPCAIDNGVIESAYYDDSDEAIVWEEIVEHPMNGSPGTIYGCFIPKNVGLVPRNIFDYDNLEVELVNGSRLDMDIYLQVRDTGFN